MPLYNQDLDAAGAREQVRALLAALVNWTRRLRGDEQIEAAP